MHIFAQFAHGFKFNSCPVHSIFHTFLHKIGVVTRLARQADARRLAGDPGRPFYACTQYFFPILARRKNVQKLRKFFLQF